MKHSVSLMVGVLDPHRPQPRIARPCSVPAWFAGLILLMVALMGLGVEVKRQMRWAWRDRGAWVEWVIGLGMGQVWQGPVWVMG